VPFADSHGYRIYCCLEGSPGKPLLVLVHSLGTDQCATHKCRGFCVYGPTRSYIAVEKIGNILTLTPGNGHPIGGIKVVTRNGWFAALWNKGSRAIDVILTSPFRGNSS
jgi:phosphoglucomutase